VILMGTMREIHPDNIHAGLDHVIQHMLLIRGRAKCCDDLGTSWHLQSAGIVLVLWRSRCRMPGLFRPFFQHRDCRQGLAFKILQEGTARRGNIGHLVVNIVFLDCGNRVAAARQAEALGIGNRH
jgi:hypothetical protein